jgi:hypothetical protein
MAYPKIKPCPKCGSGAVSVITYDSGWRYVECDCCWYHGPGEGNIRAAIKAHNAKVADQPNPPLLPGSSP